MIPGSARTLADLKWRYENAKGEAMPEDDKMREFALKYARDFERKCGQPPHGHHPFPDYQDTKFVIEYYGPGGSLNEQVQRFRQQNSADRA